jgi:hypothetical protein
MKCLFFIPMLQHHPKHHNGTNSHIATLQWPQFEGKAAKTLTAH